jgi:parallel beta-helix repeat protein
VKKRLLIATLLLVCPQLRADTLSVDGGAYSTIQSAINDANDDDTVVVSPGRYYENINFLGKAITVTSTEPNDPNVVWTTIIDGNQPPDANKASVVTFENGEDLNSVLSGFTITGGTGSWLAAGYWNLVGDDFTTYWNRCGGGVICCNMSEPTITKNIFIENSAGQGGGIYIYGNTISYPVVAVCPVITENSFISNHATVQHGYLPPNNDYPANDHGDGGAIAAFQGCDAVIKDNLVQNNDAKMYGGGIHLRQWSDGQIENNRIIDNRSSLGAGLHITYISSPIIRANRIEQNTAGNFGGGGIYVYYLSEPVIEQNIITGNTSPNGAGIAVYFSSNPLIRNNLIFKNKNGAGIRARGGAEPNIIHNTISGNTAQSFSGGICCTENAAPIIENNIITDSGTGYGIHVDEISCPVVRYNNTWNNAAGDYGPGIEDQTGVNGNISVPPNFIEPDGNDFRLNYNSKCINAGDPNFNGPATTDFDGEPRKMGPRIDIGADEAWRVWNTSSGCFYDGIQAAIDDANDLDTIITMPDRYYENINFQGKNITVTSIDPNDWSIIKQTVIDGNNLDSVVIFESAEDANCVLAGFTITNGLASTDYGGGVRIRNYSGPTIRNNLITRNSAKKGAGICLYHSFAHILGNRIVNNSSTAIGQGGGIMIIDCFEDPNAIIANNAIVGNSNLYGGGIRIQNSTATIVNNTIAYNRAQWEGIGVYAEGDAIENCIVWGNINTGTTGQGSAIYQCTATYSCIDDEVIGEGNISEEPNFVNPGYWDDANTPGNLDDDFFVYGNYHILPGSACIDAGDSNAVPEILTTDMDDEARIFAQSVEIGPDEVLTNPADFNADGIVDYLDANVLFSEWLISGDELQSDLHQDNFIDLADYAELGCQWLWQAGWHK